MKTLISYMKQSKGFVLGYTMLFGALVLIAIAAIVYLLPSRQATTLHTKYSNKALYLADSGIQHALSQIRQYATRPEGLEDIYVDIVPVNKYEKENFSYRYEVAIETITIPSYYEQLIVSATSYGYVTLKRLNKTITRYIHVLVEVNTLSDYFQISTKTLKVGRGLDISNADIYGYELVFLNDGTTNYTKVNKADYFDSVQNAPSSWVKIGGQTNVPANKLQMKVDLPLLNEIIGRYKDLASTTNYMLNSSGLLGESNCTNNYTANIPPPGESDIYPPLNGQGIYYSPGSIEIGNPDFPTTIHGQIIFVTTYTITIRGDLMKSCDGTDSDGDGYTDADADKDGNIDELNSWGSDYDVAFASITVPTSLLGLMSGSNIYVDKTDGSNVAQTITIEALIMAAGGRFTVTSGVKLNSTAVFTFLGSIMIREGISFSHVYVNAANRDYTYDEDLREYGLPHMPYQANILYYHSG